MTASISKSHKKTAHRAKSAPTPKAAPKTSKFGGKQPAASNPVDTVATTKGDSGETGSVPVNFDAWGMDDKPSLIGENGLFKDPSNLTNDEIRGEMTAMSPEELASTRNNALDAAHAHEGQMFEHIEGLNLDEAGMKELGQSMFYGIAENYFQVNGEDPKAAPSADQIRSFVTEKYPEGSAERTDFSNTINGWAEENPFYAQRGRAQGATSWAYNNYDEGAPLAEQQNMLGIVNNGNSVVGHGRVAVQTFEQQLLNQQ